jgi:phytoene synthase
LSKELQVTLDAAYAACRAIARREAKNFYYAFVALPAPRRNAICAIYAFMRQADDLADDESISIEERRTRIDEWLGQWRSTCAVPNNEFIPFDPVFIAVHDATERFKIPLELLEELVAGVTMDLDRSVGFHPEQAINGCHPEQPINDCHPERAQRVEGSAVSNVGTKERDHIPDTYATFADLYRYCYLVASVVGLVCIRIFGYQDPRAEKLAEETGIAFQLTNILRDVAEDAQRNRVYLPLEDLAAHKVSLDSLLHRKTAAPPTENERTLLKEIGRRAEGYYQSAQALMPLIDKESRPALWVLVTINHGLLKRIEHSDYDVFSSRASVPMFEKLSILAVGLFRMGWARMFS